MAIQPRGSIQVLRQKNETFHDNMRFTDLLHFSSKE